MYTLEKLKDLNSMLIDILSLDNSEFHLLTEQEELTLLRIHLEIFNISHKNDIFNININKEE